MLEKLGTDDYFYRDMSGIESDWQYVWDFEDFSKPGKWELVVTTEKNLDFDQIVFWLVTIKSLPTLTWQFLKNNEAIESSFSCYFALTDFDEYREEAARRIAMHQDLEFVCFVVNSTNNQILSKAIVNITEDFLNQLKEACLNSTLTAKEISELGKSIKSGKACPETIFQFIGAKQ